MNQNTEDVYKVEQNKEVRKIKSRIIKYLLIMISFILLNILAISTSVQAVDISSANLFTENECRNLLKYKGVVVKVTYVEYKQGENIINSGKY